MYTHYFSRHRQPPDAANQPHLPVVLADVHLFTHPAHHVPGGQHQRAGQTAGAHALQCADRRLVNGSAALLRSAGRRCGGAERSSLLLHDAPSDVGRE